MNHASAAGSRLSKSFLAIGAALFASGATSCVSPQQHDEAIAQIKSHQERRYELERENEELKRQIARLGEQRMVTEASTVDASYGDDLEAKLREYEAQIAALGRPFEDIERFDVDGGYVYMVQDAVLFDSGKAEINAAGRSALEQLAREIEQQPYGRVWVRGHTDADPVKKPETLQRFPHGNLQLSAARAIEVAAILTQRGMLDATRVAVAGFGPYEPLKPNSSAENKRLNRRVEIFVADVR